MKKISVRVCVYIHLYMMGEMRLVKIQIRIGNKMLSLFKKWAKENGLGINPKKSKCLVIG